MINAELFRADPSLMRYFPLRSNVHYWDIRSLDLDLESRIKLNALLYDRLIFEDGVYTALVGPRLSMEMVRPTGIGPSDEEFQRTFSREGGEFAVSFDGKMITSPAQRRYQLSFRELLESAGISDLAWVSFISSELTDEGKAIVGQRTSTDMAYLGSPVEDDTYLLEKQILKSLNHDMLTSAVTGWDLNVDPLHGDWLSRKLRASISSPEVRPPTCIELAFPELPDFSLISWDEVLAIRSHPSVAEFRKQLRQVSEEARDAFITGPSADTVRYHVLRLRDKQWASEFAALLPPARKVGGTIALSVLRVIVEQTLSLFCPLGAPLVSIGGLALDIVQELQHHTRRRGSLAAEFLRHSRKRD